MGIEIMSAISSETVSHFSSNPLFSCIITLYTLIVIYFPCALKIYLSPVLILTAVLLLFLLRLGAIQRLQNRNPDRNENKRNTESKENNRDGVLDEAEKSGFFDKVDKRVAFRGETGIGPNPEPDFEGSFVEWDVKAPLEVIYEAYEGEEDELEDDNERHQNSDPTWSATLERYPSLSMYYPETDSDTSSDGGFSVNGEWDSPESVCFRWEDEDRAGLLIEIALDSNSKKHRGPGFQVEEDNLIEIAL